MFATRTQRRGTLNQSPFSTVTCSFAELKKMNDGKKILHFTFQVEISVKTAMSNKRKEWQPRGPRGPREYIADNREGSSQQRSHTPHRPFDNQRSPNVQSRSTAPKRPRSSTEDTRPSQRPHHHHPQRQQPRQSQHQQSHHHFNQHQRPPSNPQNPSYHSRQHQQQLQTRTQQHQHNRERTNQVTPVIQALIVSAPAPTTNSTPQDPAIREIPGFYYDLEKKKYFKITANHTLGGQFAFSQQSIKEKTIQKVQTYLAVCSSARDIWTCRVLIQVVIICPCRLANSRTYQETYQQSIPYIDDTIWPLGLVSSGSTAWISRKPPEAAMVLRSIYLWLLTEACLTDPYVTH